MHVSEDPRTCDCGRASGYLTSKRNIVTDGPGIIIGIDDAKLERAVTQQPNTGRGTSVFAFVMPKESPTVNRPSP